MTTNLIKLLSKKETNKLVFKSFKIFRYNGLVKRNREIILLEIRHYFKEKIIKTEFIKTDESITIIQIKKKEIGEIKRQLLLSNYKENIY